MSNTPPIETNVTLCSTDITLRQVSPGTPVYMWGSMRFRHTVTIEANGVLTTFPYHTSTLNYVQHKDRLTETELFDVLECVISDAIAGTHDCKEFFAEFGYEDPCEGIKAWRACIKTFEMLNGMGIDEDMLCKMSNELADITSRSD